MEAANEMPLKLAVARALMGRCPACGQGKLMRGYLKQVENCAACGESFGQIRADTGVTILMVTHTEQLVTYGTRHVALKAGALDPGAA